MPYPVSSVRGKIRVNDSELLPDLLYLDTSKIVGSNNDPVTTWIDASISGFNATQSVTGSKPTYHTNIANGKPSVYFDDDFLGVSGPSYVAANTIIVVATRTQTKLIGFLLTSDGSGGIPAIISESNGAPIEWYNGSTVNRKPFITWGDGINVYTVVQTDGALLKGYTNGRLDFSSTPTAALNGRKLVNIGSLSSGSGGIKGDILEMRIYSKVLSDAERIAAENLLITKYGITPINLTADQILCDGDSITWGQGAIGNGYVDQLKVLRPTMLIRNLGCAGRTQANMTSYRAVRINPLYSANRTKNVVVIYGGINDIANSVSGATCYGNLLTYTQAVKTAGFLCVNSTLMPATTVSGAKETERLAFNALVLANSAGADMVIDPTADARLNTCTDETYFYTDHIHLNAIGYGILAGIVDTSLNQ